MSTIACVSLFGDPLHIGHLELLKRAKQMADVLYVIVNNDTQACLKKGASFMRDTERLEIVRALGYVDCAILAVDTDETVAKTIELIRPTYFCNGGDVRNFLLPMAEIQACHNCNTRLVDGLGHKIQSSRNLTGLMPIKSPKTMKKKSLSPYNTLTVEEHVPRRRLKST
jgi:cytidyltransferase-like protein